MLKLYYPEYPKELHNIHRRQEVPQELDELEEQYIKELWTYGRVISPNLRRSGRTTSLRVFAYEYSDKYPERTIIWINTFRYNYSQDDIESLKWNEIFLIDNNCKNPYIVDLIKNPEWTDDFKDLMNLRPSKIPLESLENDREDSYYLAKGLINFVQNAEFVAEKFAKFPIDHPIN
jgi:hypothetical protein